MPTSDLHGFESSAIGADDARPTLDQLYRSHALEVRAWILARTSPLRCAPQDVDDLAQEVWLRVTSSFPRYDPGRGSLRGWICGIAQHTTLDFLRTRRGDTTSLDDPGVRSPEAPGPAGARRWNPASGLPPELWSKLAGLRDDDFDLLRICGLEGRPTSAAALELALSGATVRKRWQRLKRRLAQRTDLAELVR